MFIGREKELETLNRHYASGKFEFVTIYGRRRVGKTTLIQKFCKGKKTILFPAFETTAKNNLGLLSAAIFSCTDPDMNTPPSFDSFKRAFERIAELAENERIIFVIDEFPYLAESDRSVSSLLQNMIDHRFRDTKLMIILCGSSMSFMENQVLGYNSPLYGRMTAQIKLLPFGYADITKWFPSYTPEETALVYAVLGGVPMYLEKFSGNRSVRDNILEAVMDKDAVLFEEPSNLLRQELREPKTYNAIIIAIADGRTKLSEISSEVEIESGTLSKYMDNLISLGIVKKERAMLSENNKRTIYIIADNLFRFWYRFVPRNMVAIVSGNMPKIYDAAVAAYLPEFMGQAFETICKEFMLRSDSPFVVSRIGKWWGGDPKTREQTEIDIVALSHDSKEAVMGSCKYRNEKTSADDLNGLKKSAEAMGGSFEKKYYHIFSKSGVSSSLIEAAESDGSVRLISLRDIYDSAG
jgi:AAA+ ATPase superfamily predicted ATPase